MSRYSPEEVEEIIRSISTWVGGPDAEPLPLRNRFAILLARLREHPLPTGNPSLPALDVPDHEILYDFATSVWPSFEETFAAAMQAKIRSTIRPLVSFTPAMELAALLDGFAREHEHGCVAKCEAMLSTLSEYGQSAVRSFLDSKITMRGTTYTWTALAARAPDLFMDEVLEQFSSGRS